MKLLFDQNLSRKLVARLADVFPSSSHVQFYSLIETEDTDIIAYWIVLNCTEMRSPRYQSQANLTLDANSCSCSEF